MSKGVKKQDLENPARKYSVNSLFLHYICARDFLNPARLH